MPDADQTALENARKALRAAAGHRTRAGQLRKDESTGFEMHGRPHLVTFKQDVTIVLQKGRARPDGSGFEPDGEPQELRYRAGEIVQRPAGIWRITVKNGTADFEKDFEPPSVRRDDAPML
jgi:hypothetical protein